MQEIASSGNEIVDAIGRIKYTGNLIPCSWYERITLSSGRPDMVGITLLSEIFYWYRPKEVKKGDNIIWEKKFRSDYLQKSIRDLANKFNFSYDQVKNALNRLETNGFIIKHTRNEVINGRKYGNVLYIEIVPQRIEDPQGTNTQGSVDENLRLSISEPKAQGTNPLTNTESTTEIITKDYHITPIPEVENIFKNQIGYDAIVSDLPFKKAQLDEIVSIAVDVLTSNKATTRVNKEERPTEQVKENFKKLDIGHIKYVLDSIDNCTSEIKNVRAVIITSLYNSASTIDNYYTAKVNHDLAKERRRCG